jgi:hypothetical protein
MTLLRASIWVLVLTAGLALARKVVFNYDPGLDFSGFHTYKWITIDEGNGVDKLTAQNIVNLVSTELAKKGFVLAGGARDADLYVGYQAAVDAQKPMTWFNAGGSSWKSGTGSDTASAIDAGTLVIDFYNPARKQLVWRGTATDTLKPGTDANKNYGRIRDAIGKILKNFPPRVKK